MNEAFYHYGLLVALPAALLLAAGLSWRRLASGITLALVIAVAGAALSAVAGFCIARQFDHSSGEWRGLGAFAVGVLSLFGGFIVFLTGALVWLIKTGRLNRSCSERSPILLGFAGVGLTVVAFCLVNIFIGSTQTFASADRLVQQIRDGADYPGTTEALAQRGAAAVPAILAELHRYPHAEKDMRPADWHSMRPEPFLEILGHIGGAEAVAELHAWATADWPRARAAALCALAAQGDASVAPLIAETLRKNGAAEKHLDLKLIRALGALKATNEVSAVRAKLTTSLDQIDNMGRQAGNYDQDRRAIQNWARDDMNLEYATAQTAVIALGNIGGEEAVAGLTKVATNPNPHQRAFVAILLEKCPGSQATAILARALDDPDAAVRQCAYTALWHKEPSLQGGIGETWSAAGSDKMRAGLTQMGVRKD